MSDFVPVLAITLLGLLLLGLLLIVIDWPRRVARRRNHRSADAITLMAWLGGLFFFPVWFVALFWAFSVPEPVATPASALMTKQRPRRFRIEGIDIASKTEAVEYIEASSADNAKALAEIQGMKVTRVDAE